MHDGWIGGLLDFASGKATRPPGGLVGGQWITDGDEAIEVFNPATAEVLCTVPASTLSDVDRAARGARSSFESGVWRRLPGRDRAAILWRVADIIDARAPRLAMLETLNNGMLLQSAERLVRLGAETFRYFAGFCTKIHGLTTESVTPTGRYHAFTLREPVGVAGLIVPWNSPFAFACNKLAVALAAGCSAVLKPAEETPLTALALGEILLEAGVPRDVANIITGRGEIVGAALVAHPDVDKIGFTGSTDVGKSIFRTCADRVKRLTLELGGKSPVIVFADADLDAAVAGIARGIFSNAGQVCMAGSRVYVQRESLDQVVHGLARIASNTSVGSGFDKTSQMGPLISENHLRRVTSLVEKGVSARAEITCGGRRVGGKGFFFQPTIIKEPALDSEIVREEVFGPVATVTAFDDEQAAVRLANDTEYGLAAAIWTSDLVRAHRMAKDIRAGNVWLNCQTVTDRMVPFGGFKQSGLGRESGAEGLDAYLETKAVFFPLDV